MEVRHAQPLVLDSLHRLAPPSGGHPKIFQGPPPPQYESFRVAPLVATTSVKNSNSNIYLVTCVFNLSSPLFPLDFLKLIHRVQKYFMQTNPQQFLPSAEYSRGGYKCDIVMQTFFLKSALTILFP